LIFIEEAHNAHAFVFLLLLFSLLGKGYMSFISMLRKCTCFNRFYMYSSSIFRLGFRPIPIEGLLARFF
jgi:hypothetical protein